MAGSVLFMLIKIAILSSLAHRRQLCTTVPMLSTCSTVTFVRCTYNYDRLHDSHVFADLPVCDANQYTCSVGHGSPIISPELCNMDFALLWCRPAGTVPYRSFRRCCVVVLNVKLCVATICNVLGFVLGYARV